MHYGVGWSSLKLISFNFDSIDQHNSVINDDSGQRNNAKNGEKPKRTSKKPKYLNDYYLNDDDNDNLCMITHCCYSAKFDVPKTYSQAISSNDKHKWNEAMEKEMNALVENDTYDIVPLPKSRECVGGKWVYTIKTDQFENELFKARFVAKGYSQV